MLNKIEELVKEISRLLYMIHIKSSDEYICKNKDALLEIKLCESRLEIYLEKLNWLLDKYIGVKEYKVLGFTCYVKHNKVGGYDNGFGIENRIVLLDNGSRE